LSRLIAERRGDVVVLAGRNGGKALTFRRLHAAGFHVLADKPWLVEPEDLEDIRASLTGWPLVTEIMTGRHDVAAGLFKRLVDAREIFGGFATDGARGAIEQEASPLRSAWTARSPPLVVLRSARPGQRRGGHPHAPDRSGPVAARRRRRAG
jgi:hypothetical protein